MEKETAEQKKLNLILATKRIFDSEDGKRLLSELKLCCHDRHDVTPYDINSERNTCYRLGQNSIVRYIQYMIEQPVGEEKPTVAITEDDGNK